MVGANVTRKRRGAWYTPADLVRVVVDGVMADLAAVRDPVTWRDPIRVLDPACGDGRLLEELRVRLHLAGFAVEAIGFDVDGDALASIVHPNVRTVLADALSHDWGDDRYDVVIGNPPFLNQMAAATTRGGASRHGGGPYADAAAEFLALGVGLARPDGGCIGLVLPQSILAARDAGPVRDAVDRMAAHTWSWWEPEQRLFDASVNVCALGFRRPAVGPPRPRAWTGVVAERLGVPAVDLDALDVAGTLGDRAELNANFRDEYYALVPAVGDHGEGPRFVTSGLIDPGRCRWGDRRVRFAKRLFDRPRVDLSALTGRFPDWAARKLVPKVLVASQTPVIEAYADRAGDCLPGVPVTTVIPADPSADAIEAIDAIDAIEAMLTSPVASAIAWHLNAGTGLSTTALRLGPSVLARLPWPGGDLRPAAERLAAGDVVGCGEATLAAYGVADDAAERLLAWWAARLPGGDE